MRVLRCLILDLDGTVIDSHAYTFAAFRYACAPFIAPPADDEIYGRFGPDENVILHDLVGAAHAAEAYTRLQDYYAAHVEDVQVHPDVPPLLADCERSGVARGLFTGRGRTSTWFLLHRLHLAHCFDAVVAGDEAAPKPAPDGITLLLQRLGCSPRETLLVGDSPLDLQAATAAGVQALRAVWFARAALQPKALQGGLETPAELARLLE